MRDDANAADAFGGAESRFQREQKKGRGIPLSLIIRVDCELSEQGGGRGIGPIALMRLRQASALDLRSVKRDIVDDPACRGVGYDINA